MIIDSHAHIFPDKIAEKASQGISDFYGMETRFDGKIETLLKIGENAGIDKFVVQSVATIPEQTPSINNFIAEATENYPDKFIGFAALHPDYHDIEGEIKRAASLGLKGIKLHPDFQRFHIDGVRAMKIYEMAEGKLPILIHAGDYRYDYSKPARLARVLEAFPKLDVIAAHFGGWSEWEDAVSALAGKRLWVDTSSSLYAMTPERAYELIRLFGADRVVFGTDYPMWNGADELSLIDKIDLSHDEREKILHLNIERLLNI